MILVPPSHIPDSLSLSTIFHTEHFGRDLMKPITFLSGISLNTTCIKLTDPQSNRDSVSQHYELILSWLIYIGQEIIKSLQNAHNIRLRLKYILLSQKVLKSKNTRLESSSG